jgi:hypothetical protein
MALYADDVPIQDIVYRRWWIGNAIQFYIRESGQATEILSTQVLLGTFAASP